MQVHQVRSHGIKLWCFYTMFWVLSGVWRQHNATNLLGCSSFRGYNDNRQAGFSRVTALLADPYAAIYAYSST